MSRWSILLRVLLSLSLVLEGGGWAMASAQRHVPSAGMGSERASAASADDAMRACHGHHGAAAHVALAGHAAPHGHAAPDCCTSGDCDGACLHAQATVAMSSLPVAVAPDAPPAVTRLVRGHASPTLPHLIRPPIG